MSDVTVQPIALRVHGAGRKIGLLLTAAVGAWMWAMAHSPWYLERQWGHLPLAELERESAAHPDESIFLYYLGLRLNEAYRFEEAVPVLERAAGLDPDAPQQREQWAKALLGVGQVSAAFVELRQFVGSHPHNGQGHMALGKFYMTQRALSRAADEFSQSVKLEPDNGEAWAFLASARSNLEDPSGALPAAEKAAALRPNNVTDRLLLASIDARLNRNDPARAAYETACRLGPNRPDAHRELALWLLDHPVSLQDSNRAEAEARQAIALDEGNARTFLILGRILIRGHRDVEALEPLKRSALIDPINPAPLLAIQQIYNRLGQTVETHRWAGLYLKCQRQNALNDALQDEISKHPSNPAPHRQLARLMADWGDVVECLKHEASALRCPRDAPPALLAAAHDLTDVGRPGDSLPLVNQALISGADNVTTHELRGDNLLALDQPREAAAEYDLVVASMPDREPAYRSKLSHYFARHRKTVGRAQIPEGFPRLR